MKKCIRVNPAQIQTNYKHMQAGYPELVEPAIVVELPNGETIAAFSVEILGPDGKPVARLIQQDQAPLKSGARVWLETESEIEIHLTR